MGYKSSRFAVLGTAAGFVAALGLSTSAAAEPTSGTAAPPLTDLQIAQMNPTAQALLLNPLRAAADALGTYGPGAGAALFGNVGIDANYGTVDLYLTDPTKASAFESAASEAVPGLGLGMVQVHPGSYTLHDLDAAARNFISGKHGYAVYAVSVNPDSSGLTIKVADPAAASATETPRSAIPAITFKQGTAPGPLSWNDVKWHDSSPFIGGDTLTNDGHGYCAAGIPAVRISDNQPIMVTAAHCFGVGTRVYTGGGPTFQYNNGQLGNPVGQVTDRAEQWDAEIMPAQNNADESDTNTYYPLTSTKYSYNGDFVCQSGPRSAALGHPTPCSIKVINDDTPFPVNGYIARGVEGNDVNGWGTIAGDSGATVFAYVGTPGRQLRGIVSAGTNTDPTNQPSFYWTEAIDIFNQFGLKLNPTT